MGFSGWILVVCGLAAAGIVAYSIIFYRRGVVMGAETLRTALQRSMDEEGAEAPAREEILEALTYLKRRFLVVAVLAAVFAAICLAVFIAIMALGTARETGFALLGVSWILIAGCVGLLVARRLVPLMEENLQDED